MVQKAFNVQGYDVQAKTIFFLSTMLFNNLVLTSYLSAILLGIMVFLVMGRSPENIKKRRKQAEEEHWKVKRKKNEEYEESQITTIYIFIGFKLYFARKHILKTICLYLYTIPWNFIYSFYALQDVWNTVMIHQSSIYINIQIIIWWKYT